MDEDVCTTCKGEGRPNGCPMCYKVGYPKKIKKVKQETVEERRTRLKQEIIDRLAKRVADQKSKLEEIKALWASADQEAWEKNQGNYREIIKVAKRKEKHFIESELDS